MRENEMSFNQKSPFSEISYSPTSAPGERVGTGWTGFPNIRRGWSAAELHPHQRYGAVLLAFGSRLSCKLAFLVTRTLTKSYVVLPPFQFTGFL
jgi:hypothetical protein